MVVKRRFWTLLWGGLLIILGLGLLAENLDLLGDLQFPVWSLLLGAFSLVFLATYVGDREQWWALIPGLVILGVAAGVFVAELDLVEGYVVATIILAGVGLPFLMIFLTDREHWWALIPGFTMCAAALGVLLEGAGVVRGEAVGGIIVGGISLGFFAIYLIDRGQWWALIPGSIMGVVAFFLLVATAGEYVWPVALIVLGLLLLRGSLGGSRRRTHRDVPVQRPISPAEVEQLDREVDKLGGRVAPAQPERKRLPTLEEQIRAAINADEEPATVPEDDDRDPGDNVPPPAGVV